MLDSTKVNVLDQTQLNAVKGGNDSSNNSDIANDIVIIDDILT